MVSVGTDMVVAKYNQDGIIWSCSPLYDGTDLSWSQMVVTRYSKYGLIWLCLLLRKGIVEIP